MLDGKVAIVTGAGGAIGAAVAKHLAASGAHVVVNDLGGGVTGSGRDAGPAQRIADAIAAAGGEASAGSEDVSDWADAQRLVQRALDTFGHLDIVINNAAIQDFVNFEETSFDHFDKHMRVNVYGCFNVARAAAPVFVKAQAGAYVHMTSSTGLIGMAGNAPYMTSKAALIGLSRSIALDMAKYNVRSNCLAPAAVSRMSPKRADEATEALYRDRMRPELVAPITTYLASDAAAGVTGQIFGVRGTELYLYSQPRPIRTLQRNDGWSLESIAEQVGPTWRAALTPLEDTYHVFSWPPL
ncbi:SDR family NAD(P)-dependent oxidoreductase [Terricaulis silvestris]|uniref:D-xylose 1-dehydrogenase n=1 Tax=Terricaulis silvestris TaxID=2686094 RepID=A0A6I6ML14_9CAUL|nr:SDR family oxidoreductase [Terricaulis silvestris]QGZ93654.1 Putative short-chain type dehydrogenase/reductase [Terricaulis silvestris]